MIGLFVGKFQPFHKGHLETIKYILGECDSLKIVIGSSQYSGTENNPFSLEERKEMVRLAMAEASITNYTIHQIKDVHNLPLWAGLLIKSFSPFDLVYTRNPRVASILKQKGTKTKQQPNFGEFNGTKIRRKIAAGEPWEEWAPPAVAAYLKKLGTQNRFKSLNPPTPTC